MYRDYAIKNSTSAADQPGHIAGDDPWGMSARSLTFSITGEHDPGTTRDLVPPSGCHDYSSGRITHRTTLPTTDSAGRTIPATFRAGWCTWDIPDALPWSRDHLHGTSHSAATSKPNLACCDSFANSYKFAHTRCKPNPGSRATLPGSAIHSDPARLPWSGCVTYISRISWSGNTDPPPHEHPTDTVCSEPNQHDNRIADRKVHSGNRYTSCDAHRDASPSASHTTAFRQPYQYLALMECC